MESAHTSVKDIGQEAHGYINSINNDLPCKNNGKLSRDLPELQPLQPRNDKDACSSNKRRQIAIIVLLAIAATCSAESISLFSPFYPQLAEDKGSSASVYGFVLGSNSFIMFLVTPMIGKHVKVFGLKLAFTLGMFIIGTCSIITGFQDHFHPGAIFIFMSIAIRIVQALGNAVVLTSSFAIMGAEFPNSVAKVFGLTRLCVQIGYLIGPILGGLFYQIGDRSLPFMVLGGFHCAVALLTYHLHPGYKEAAVKTTAKDKKCVTIRSILLTPGAWIAFCTFIISTFTNGFLPVTLGPEILKQFVLAPTVLAMLFTLKDFIAGISAPIWGYLGDKAKYRKPFIAIGAAISGSSLLLLTQFSVAPLERLWFVVVGLILNAIGTSGEQVIAVLDSLCLIIKEGNADDPDLHGCLAGLWSSFCGLGRFLSRSLSGILVDYYGHRTATMIVSGLNLFWASVIIIYLYVKSIRCRSWDQTKSEESETLLSARRKSFLMTEALEYESNHTYGMV